MKLILILFALFLPLLSEQFLLQKIVKNKAIIKAQNLPIGQSGIVLHKFKNQKSIILSYATVIQSNIKQSTIEFLNINTISQEALPTTNLKPSINDIFIPRHLYKASLMIVPNFEAKQKVQKLYPTHTFLNNDIFASFLKIHDIPVPTKKTIQDFAISNNLGSIIFSINNKVYLVDTLSFKIIKTHSIALQDKSFITPFLTNVKEIRTSSFDFTSLDKIENYNKYYKQLLGI